MMPQMCTGGPPGPQTLMSSFLLRPIQPTRMARHWTGHRLMVLVTALILVKAVLLVPAHVLHGLPGA